jgi:DNA polymerase
VAGETKLLTAFANHQDVYLQMAMRIFGREVTKQDKDARQIGKITVLGAGYSMSATKFAAFCEANRIDLAAAGTTAEQCIEAYRDAYPNIAGTKVTGQTFRRGGIWRTYEQAATIAAKGGRAEAGRCRFFKRDGALVIELPSGRELLYRDCRIEDRIPPYYALLGLQGKPKPTIVYAHPHRYESTLYGGLITENIVQAICRDLLATAIVRCELEGLPVVLHVHDELVLEVPEPEGARALRRLAEIMVDPPGWAAGFPLAVEGYTAPRYVKTPFVDSAHIAL